MMHNHLRFTKQSWAAAVVLLAVLVGCGGAAKKTTDRVRVSGEVSYKGQPLKGGTVCFISEASRRRRAYGMIQPDGTYMIPNVPPGAAAVSIDTGSVYYGAREFYTEIPMKYASIKTSGLTVQVENGENHFAFDLQ